jgi:hypothetical protein
MGQRYLPITAELSASLLAELIEEVLALFIVSSEERTRGVAKPASTFLHPVPKGVLAESDKGYQIVWPLALL